METITKEQFRAAIEIKKAQDQLETWEKAANWHDLKNDEAAHGSWELCRKWSLEMYQEKLLELTGNPRGFLEG